MSIIEKTFDILEAILKHDDEISISGLAKATGQSIGTTHRICKALANRGYIYQRKQRGKYSLGFKFLLFNDINHVTRNIKNVALPFLKELSEKISETIVMSVFDGFEPIDVFSVIPDTILKASPGLGTKSPFHCTAVGKVFLANSSPEMIEIVLNSPKFHVYTDNTIIDANRLKAELDVIKGDDLAFDDEEYIEGLRSVATPIRAENGDMLASICFIAPSTRVSFSRMKQIAPLIKNYGLAISKALVYTGK